MLAGMKSLANWGEDYRRQFERIYPDLAAVQLAFTRLLLMVPRGGLVVAGTESPALVEILGRARCRVETFGLHGAADWRATLVAGSVGLAVMRGRLNPVAALLGGALAGACICG